MRKSYKANYTYRISLLLKNLLLSNCGQAISNFEQSVSYLRNLSVRIINGEVTESVLNKNKSTIVLGQSIDSVFLRSFCPLALNT